METKPRPKDFITKNKFDVSNILKRLENTSAKPTTIQDLQTKIKNLNQEVKELRQQRHTQFNLTLPKQKRAHACQ